MNMTEDSVKEKENENGEQKTIEQQFTEHLVKLIEEKVGNLPLEITTLADIPSGTGLGSSGSFTSSLIKALYEYRGKKISKQTLAEKSCEIEINKLKDPVGKQDQYIATFGGIKSFDFYKNEKVQP